MSAPIPLSSPSFRHLTERTGLIRCFVSTVLVLVVRVVVAPGLAAILLAVLYSSIWAPQTVHAVHRGRPCALGMRYIAGDYRGNVRHPRLIGRSLKLTSTHFVDVLWTSGVPKT